MTARVRETPLAITAYASLAAVVLCPLPFVFALAEGWSW